MRILFVGAPDSPDVAHWVNQVSAGTWDVHLLPTGEGRPHPELRGVTCHTLSMVRPPSVHESVRIRGLLPLPPDLARLVPGVPRARWLAALVGWLRPDVVHALGVQDAAPLTVSGQRRLRRPFPPTIVTNWGPDIHLYARLPDEAARISITIRSFDHYLCGSGRDLGLATRAGFPGTLHPVLPPAGGLDLAAVSAWCAPTATKTSERKRVVLMGRQDAVARALVGLYALELCAGALDGYEVAVPLAAPDVVLAADLLRQATGLDVTTYAPADGGVRSPQVLGLLAGARLVIALSISDGPGSGLLEAMATGAFPVHGDSGWAEEWLRPGETSLAVETEDPHAVAEAVRRALRDDELVDAAAAHNARVARDRLDAGVVTPQVVALYRRVAGTDRAGAPAGPVA